jgi:hypothetical protein
VTSATIDLPSHRGLPGRPRSDPGPCPLRNTEADQVRSPRRATPSALSKWPALRSQDASRSAGLGAVIHAGYAPLASRLRAQRMVSRSEYLCIGALGAVVRFCRSQGSNATGRARDLGHILALHERFILIVQEYGVGLILAHDLGSRFRWRE